MKKTIGYLGPEGSNSHVAAMRWYKNDEKLIPLSQFSLAIALRDGKVDEVVLPVENSIEGRVKWVLDLLAQNKAGHFVIIGEMNLKIKHCLIGFGTREEAVVIYSISTALGQCRTIIGTTQTRVTDSTSAAVKLMAENMERSFAAIGTRLAAKIYKVPVIQKDVGDSRKNETRFLVLGKESQKSTGHDKTSIVFEAEDKPGALCDPLLILRNLKINMTMIFSEASLDHVRGKYIFFVDFVGHQNDKRPSVALDVIREDTKFLRVLGSYPVA